MDTKVLSDKELVAVVIGDRSATKLYAGSLIPLMIGEGDVVPHPKLKASLELARRLLREELYKGPVLSRSMDTRSYLTTYFYGQPYESFVVVLLSNQNRVIRIEEMFRGTIDGATIHPREVVRMALKYNAVACIFAHNHPSGVAEPSQADRGITSRLKNALGMVDIRTLDHIVVGGEEVVSFAERGLL